MEIATPSDVDLLMHFDSTFDPPRVCGDERCQDFFPEFIYIVVAPISATLFLLFVFSLVVCCCVKRRKKPAEESEEQLAVYDAVRRASISVRRMSTSNSTPLLDGSRSGSMTLSRADHQHRRRGRPRDACHSAPGTLQRHHRNRDSASLQDTPPPPPAPPPYGASQQHYAMGGEDDVFLGPDVAQQDVAVEGQDAEPDDQQRPARPHRHHRRPRPYSAANGYMTR